LTNLSWIGYYKVVPEITVEGFDLIVNTRDERGHKPHAHVLKAGGKVQVLLDATLMPYKAYGISSRDVARSRELVGEHFEKLMGWWEKYNG
jgi:hypothetical protein